MQVFDETKKLFQNRFQIPNTGVSRSVLDLIIMRPLAQLSSPRLSALFSLWLFHTSGLFIS
jgi:hypothetical protein